MTRKGAEAERDLLKRLSRRTVRRAAGRITTSA
jgi:Holliday junction resolvase